MIRRGKKRAGKRKNGGTQSRHRFERLLPRAVASLGVLILGAMAFIVFFPTAIIDLSKFAGRSGIVFEEPNPPMHATPIQKPLVTEGKKPLVAIIIDDMGYHEKIGKELMALPLQLTFSFLPYAPFTRQQEADASSSGHTVILHLPMQPEGREWNPGPGALYVGQPEDLQARILATDLAWVPHAVGVNNHMGSLYTQDAHAMRSLLAELREKGLFFIDSVTTPKSTAYRLALELGVKTGRRQIFLDNVHSQEKIGIQMEKLMAEAGRQGRAIGIGHPYPETLQALTANVRALKERVQLVGVEKLVH